MSIAFDVNSQEQTILSVRRYIESLNHGQSNRFLPMRMGNPKNPLVKSRTFQFAAYRSIDTIEITTPGNIIEEEQLIDNCGHSWKTYD